MLTIQDSTVAQLEAAPTFKALLDEYGAESAIAGLPPPSAEMERYRVLEGVGVLHVISATFDDELIGLATVLYAPLPHYAGAAVAASESIFVRPARRNTGAGLRLIKAAERKAAALGCENFMPSAPVGSDLERVLSRLGYRPTNTVFLKKVAP